MKFTNIEDFNTAEKCHDFSVLCRNNTATVMRMLMDVIKQRDELKRGNYTFSVPDPKSSTVVTSTAKKVGTRKVAKVVPKTKTIEKTKKKTTKKKRTRKKKK